jgi:hypothetical protein
MPPPTKHDLNHNEALRIYVLERDLHRCQWPGCGMADKVDVLFVLETIGQNEPVSQFYQNGITVCPKHMEIANLHEKMFGPLVYDLIQLVEFESDLKVHEKNYKDILRK